MFVYNIAILIAYGLTGRKKRSKKELCKPSGNSRHKKCPSPSEIKDRVGLVIRSPFDDLNVVTKEN